MYHEWGIIYRWSTFVQKIWLLALVSRDLHQAEKNVIIAKPVQIHKMTTA